MDKADWAFAALNFLFPITLIIVLLLMGHSINFVGFWAITSVVAVSLIRKKTRPGLKKFVRGFMEGTQQATAIGVCTACIGLILSTLNMSGLGVKLVLGIEAWSHGYLPLALLLIFVISVIMGMGGASITSYIIVSVFTVPALQKMGLSFEQGHFFAMFVSVFAFLTPPVAMVALIASRVAGGSYIRTSIESTKAALGGFLLPFTIAYCPLMLLSPKNWRVEIFSLLATILLLVNLQSAFVGFFIEKCSRWMRGVMLGSGAILFCFLFTGNYLFLLGGLILFGGAISFQLKTRENDTN